MPQIGSLTAQPAVHVHFSYKVQSTKPVSTGRDDASQHLLAPGTHLPLTRPPRAVYKQGGGGGPSAKSQTRRRRCVQNLKPVAVGMERGNEPGTRALTQVR